MAARKSKITHDAQQVQAYGYDLSTGTHGTYFREKQREVTPAGEKRAVNFKESHPDRAYYTAHKHGDPLSSERKGWTWAHQATNILSNREGGVLGRPVVHEVVPKSGSTIDQDPYTKEWREPSAGQVTSDKGLKITDTHWIPPVSPAHAAGGVVGHQGTLPHINWNQFGPRDLEQRNWKKMMQ